MVYSTDQKPIRKTKKTSPSWSWCCSYPRITTTSQKGKVTARISSVGLFVKTCECQVFSFQEFCKPIANSCLFELTNKLMKINKHFKLITSYHFCYPQLLPMPWMLLCLLQLQSTTLVQLCVSSQIHIPCFHKGGNKIKHGGSICITEIYKCYTWRFDFVQELKEIWVWCM